MLTNGWRRFTWDEILYKHREKKEFEIEKGIFITGKTKNLKSSHENQSSEIINNDQQTRYENERQNGSKSHTRSNGKSHGN